jgi:hypothetical protein
MPYLNGEHTFEKYDQKYNPKKAVKSCFHQDFNKIQNMNPFYSENRRQSGGEGNIRMGKKNQAQTQLKINRKDKRKRK